METNTLILAGTHERVFACELEAGDVLATGETVESVVRVTDHKTRVSFTDGVAVYYGRADTTVLIETV